MAAGSASLGPLNAGFVYMAAVGAKLLMGKKEYNFWTNAWGMIQNKGNKLTNLTTFVFVLHNSITGI